MVFKCALQPKYNKYTYFINFYHFGGKLTDYKFTDDEAKVKKSN